MTFVDKLKFWKKEEDKFADLDRQLGTLQPQSGMEKTPAMDLQPPTGLETGHADMDDVMRSRTTGMEESQDDAGTGFSGFTLDHPAEKRRSPFEPQQQSTSSYEQQQPFSQQQPFASQQPMQQQQVELLSAKLDTIRVSLESINHRLVALERALHVPEYEEEQTQRRRRGVW